MTLMLGGAALSRRADISDLARLALSFVDGGLQWLDWAILTTAETFGFPDETALAGGVQMGLHASPFALLPTLKVAVSPIKLMTVGVDELKTLRRAETGDTGATTTAQVSRILAAHHIYTQDDLAPTSAFLTEMGVADAPLFQFMGFEDRLALLSLVRQADPSPPPVALQQEAAAFGVAQGRTVPEFVDYARFYIGYSAKLGQLTPDDRQAACERALAVLLPRLFPYLDAPQVNGLLPPAQVGEAVKGWLAGGRDVGFTRLSLGVQQVACNTHFENGGVEDPDQFVTVYVQHAQDLLRAHALTRGIMAQDGASCLFPIEGREFDADLRLGPTGLVTLESFRRKAKPKPAPGAETVKPAPAKPVAAKAAAAQSVVAQSVVAQSAAEVSKESAP